MAEAHSILRVSWTLLVNNLKRCFQYLVLGILLDSLMALGVPLVAQVASVHSNYTHILCACVPTLTDFTYRYAYILSKHKMMFLCGFFRLGILELAYLRERPSSLNVGSLISVRS